MQFAVVLLLLSHLLKAALFGLLLKSSIILVFFNICRSRLKWNADSRNVEQTGPPLKKILPPSCTWRPELLDVWGEEREPIYKSFYLSDATFPRP